jgi:diaminopimelate epimerase
VKFTKYHGLGNDYLVMEPTALADAAGSAGSTVRSETLAALTVRICHRNYGIGSDGILIGPLPADFMGAGAPTRDAADFGLRIINPDGSEAEKSGNGLRIFARYLHDTGRVGSEPFRIATRGGIALAQILVGRGLVRVGMGHASFDSRAIGIAGPPREVVAETMEFAGRSLSCTGVSVGNPHCVITGVPVTEGEARTLGPVVERDPRFLNRTNVQLLELIDESNIRIQIWERGAGHTLASGSSASAAACAARRIGACGPSVRVHMPGGVLDVEIGEGFEVTQTGPVTKVAEGVLSPEGLLGATAPQH